MILIVIFAVTAIVIGSLTHAAAVGIVLGAVVTGAYWVHDVKRNPRVPCRSCGGSGDNMSRIGGGPFRRPRGACSRCGGKKGVPRPALRIVDGTERKKILTAIGNAKKTIRRWGR